MAHPDREPRPEVDRAHEVGKMASGKERSWPHRDIRLTRSKSGARIIGSDRGTRRAE